MDSLRNAAHGAFKKAAEAVLPPLTKSQFEEKRVRQTSSCAKSLPLPTSTLTPPPRSLPTPRSSRPTSLCVQATTSCARARRGPGALTITRRKAAIAGADDAPLPTRRDARPSQSTSEPPPQKTTNNNNRESGDPKKARPYLPASKQYLVTRGVPCLRRAADLERATYAAGGAGGGAAPLDPRREYALSGEDEGWTATHRDPAGGKAAASEAAAAAASAAAPGPPAAKAPAKDDDGVPDLADLDIADEATVSASGPPATNTTAANTNTVSTRTYDLSVTYDQYYRVPRMWLVGYDESGAPLKPEQVLEDVSEDHARKTITVEPHPHGASAGVQAASIHPCRHAEVMKRLAERAAEGAAKGGGGASASSALTVDRYLVLFLKFIASVVPTIQYDYTMET